MAVKQQEAVTKLEQAEKALSSARETQATLRAELSGLSEKMATAKANYEEAVRNGEPESKLDDMDAVASKLNRERARLEIKLNQVGASIEALSQERAAARLEEDYQNYLQDVRAGKAEAQKLEALCRELTQLTQAHCERMGRMRRFCEGRGVGQIGYRQRNLERRIEAIFRHGSVVRTYECSYQDIFNSNVEAVERQMSHAKLDDDTPTGEQIQAETAV